MSPHRYIALVAMWLGVLAAQPANAQPSFQVFFLTVGSSYYLQPQEPGLHGFPTLSGANASAQLVAELLAKHGAVAGTTLVSAANHFVSTGDFESALKSVTSQIQQHSPANPLLIVYYAGHGISEGVAWNHFSVPGNFVYGAPLDELDIEGMAAHTIHAATLADELDKLKVPYILLLDSCYQGDPRSFQSAVLTAQAIQNLTGVQGILRYQNEFHTSSPVVFSAEPGKQVPIAADPRDPDKKSLAPLARRLFLLDHQISASGTELTLSGLVRALVSPSLDPETSPPVTHATAPDKDDLVLLASSSGRTEIVMQTGTATQPDRCCDKGADTGNAAPSQRMTGTLTFEGPAGEFISNGRRVSLSGPGASISVLERDPQSIELTFDGSDNWELDFAANDNEPLAAKTYRAAQRYSFQDPGHPGLSVTGAGRACNDVAGEFTITQLKRDTSRRLVGFDAQFVQRCEDGPPLHGQVHADAR